MFFRLDMMNNHKKLEDLNMDGTLLGRGERGWKGEGREGMDWEGGEKEEGEKVVGIEGEEEGILEIVRERGDLMGNKMGY